MSGSEGRDYLIYLSSDGTAEGAKTELECQGDATINLGRSVATTQYKNCTHSRHVDAGMTVTASIGLERPMGAAQALLWQAHDQRKPWHCWIEDDQTGGLIWSGAFKIAISEIPTPVDGDTTHSFTMGADGPIARTVKT